MTGKELYEQDIQRHPNYHDGTARKAWWKLQEVIQQHWEKLAKNDKKNDA